MDFGLIILLIMMAVFGLALLSPIIIIPYFIYRWLNRKGYKIISKVFVILFIVFVIHEVYTAIYPNDSFYFSEFELVTLRKVPESAVVLRKDASYPDFHGDYCSSFTMQVSKEDYNKLLNELNNDKRITKTIMDSSYFKNIESIENKEYSLLVEKKIALGNLKLRDVSHQFSRHIKGEEDRSLSISFFNDNRTILVTVVFT